MLTGNKNLDFTILNKLEDKDLVKVCQTNSQANELCNDQTFWFNRILNRFPYLSLDILKQYKGQRDWSEYYIKDLRQVTPTIGRNRLGIWARKGRLDLVIIAVNKGADISRHNNFAIKFASYNGHLEVVKYLVENGANIRAENDYAIRLASQNGHLDVVKYLVLQGADIRSDNDSAFRGASSYGHLEVVKYLVGLGADIRAPGPEGLNNWAVKRANSNGHQEVVEYLVGLGAPDPRN